METRAYRLTLRAPLHVGERGIGVEETLDYLPSDSLFSALAVAWQRTAALRPVLDGLAAAFKEGAPLLLTSAFPHMAGVLLFPRPHLAALPKPVETEQRQESSKDIKRVRWVSQEIFAALLAGPDQARLDALWANKVLLQKGTVWVTEADAQRIHDAQHPPGAGERPPGAARVRERVQHTTFWDEVRVPKVTVDRLSNASQIFHVGRMHFDKQSGLWFMARGEAEWLTHVEAGLRLLADDGLGGQRSRGNGQFTFETMEPPAFAQEQGGYGVLLSRFAPRAAEMALLKGRHAAYDLTLVGGFSGTPGDPPVVRRQVRLVAEGSIIGSDEAALPAAPGQLVDVTPTAPEVTARLGHPIFRYGLAYTVPIRVPAAFKEGA